MAFSDLVTIRELVLDSTKSFRDLEVQDADILEQVDPEGEPSLLIRMQAHPRQHSTNWTETRLRLSQRIRDELLRIGESRYPVITMFSSKEWPARDK